MDGETHEDKYKRQKKMVETDFNYRRYNDVVHVWELFIKEV